MSDGMGGKSQTRNRSGFCFRASPRRGGLEGNGLTRYPSEFGLPVCYKHCPPRIRHPTKKSPFRGGGRRPALALAGRRAPASCRFSGASPVGVAARRFSAPVSEPAARPQREERRRAVERNPREARHLHHCVHRRRDAVLLPLPQYLDALHRDAPHRRLGGGEVV